MTFSICFCFKRQRFNLTEQKPLIPCLLDLQWLTPSYDHLVEYVTKLHYIIIPFSTIRTRNIRFGPIVGQIRIKWDKSGTFKDYFRGIFVLKMIFKTSTFVPFGVNLTHFGAKYDIPVKPAFVHHLHAGVFYESGLSDWPKVGQIDTKWEKIWDFLSKNLLILNNSMFLSPFGPI